jgi:heterodisulfide reductase subunit A-like polyferredoxin
MALGQVKRWVASFTVMVLALPNPGLAQDAPVKDRAIACDILVVGGGLSGVAAAYEGLHAGRTVCMTELTDWVGGP